MQMKDEATVATSKHGAPRRLWRIALLVLVVLPFLPEIAIYAAAALAKIMGCQLEQKAACAIGSLQISDVIAAALTAATFVGVGLAFYGIVALWLALCYFAVTKGWPHTPSRLLLALGIALVFAFLPYFGPMLAIADLENPNCQPNEGGVGPCVMFGGNVGSPAHDVVTVGWLIVVGAPIALAALVVYVIVLFVIRATAGRRSAARPAERSL
jgi:hypothetical protein